MVNIQQKIWHGYALAAAHLGSSYAQYRATSATNPTAAGNQIATITAAFDDRANYKFLTPNLFGHPEKFALLDGSLVQPGDYLIGQLGTLFIGAMPPLLPIPCFLCNVTVNILRPTGNAGIGAQPYGGDMVSPATPAETPILTGWPAWLENGTKGEKSDTDLPGDVREPWFKIIMPAYNNIQIELADVMYDNNGRRFKISACEQSFLGWRLTATQAET